MLVKSIDFSRYSSIKIGPIVDILVIEKDNILPKGHFLIGGANNLLISPTPPPLMMLGKSFDYAKFFDDTIEVGCAMKSGRLLSFAKKNNLAGFEFIAKLPGTVGGMVAMNAGVKEYEIFNIIKSIEINGKWVDKKEIEYGYRYAKLNGVATRVRFKKEYGFNENLKDTLLKLRKNQPTEPSAGSCFKNPKGEYAGRLIEAVGLKGKRVGNMAFSQIHANFLINLGGGIYSEAKTLIDLAKERVLNKFGIKLEEEIKII